MPANLRLAEILQPHVNLQEFDGWQTHVRPGGFEPVGIIIHHTAGKNDLKTVINGRSDLPGPLSNLYFDRDGDFPVTLVSAGRCNHAGAGSSVVLEEVRDGSAAGPDAAARKLSDGPNGNYFFYGFEAENLGDGVQEWPAEQYRSMILSAAAICRFHGWTAGHVIGHREWTRRKIDPRGFSMSGFRWDVHSQLVAWSNPPVLPSVPEGYNPLESEMFIAYIEGGAAYLIAGGTKTIIDGTEIERLKAFLPVVLAPKLIAVTPSS